ncbi:MAG: hypothetical protein R3C16_03610 [Hyphomonadaceae bacterium]
MLRWPLLVAALLFGVGFFALLRSEATPLRDAFSGNSTAIANLAAAFLLLAASLTMRRDGVQAPWSMTANLIAAALWLVVLASTIAGVNVGPGDIVYGLLITLPGAGLALTLQIVALFGYIHAENKRV